MLGLLIEKLEFTAIFLVAAIAFDLEYSKNGNLIRIPVFTQINFVFVQSPFLRIW